MLVLAGTLPLCGWVAGARAGVVLISRQSWLQAAGDAPGGGPDNFNLSDGTTTSGPFANDLNHNNDATAVALADAHQYSMPMESGSSVGGLQGAYAEGTVRAELNAPQSTAQARSKFDMTFRVTGAPASYDFGGAFGTQGGGTARAQLIAAGAGGHPRSVFSAEIQGGSDGSEGPDASRTLSRHGLLSPGDYTLNVSADAPGTLASSSAYFTVDLTLDASASRGRGGLGPPGGLGAGAGPASGPAAAPMPAAVWPGLIMLVGLAVLVRTPRRNAVRWAWR